MAASGDRVRALCLNLTKAGIVTRPNASPGLWVALVLPSVLIMTTDYHKMDVVGICWCLAISTLVYMAALVEGYEHFKSRPLTFVMRTTMGAVVYFATGDKTLSITCSLFSTDAFKVIVISIMRHFPKSFTVGEAFCTAQAVSLFIYFTTRNLFKYYSRIPEHEDEFLIFILQIGLLFVITTVYSTYLFRKNLNPTKFSIIVLANISAMFLVLHIFLQQSPVLWLLFYIFSDWKKISMIIYWALMSALSTFAVNVQTTTGTKASTSRRKIFHYVAVAVYVPGILLQTNLTHFASGIALAALIALETIRKSNLGWFSDVLNDGFEVFADEKDSGGISLTPLYLLLGIAGPIFLDPLSENNSVLPLFSGILSVGIGDSVASYIGSNYGRSKWPGTSKSIEGTVANVVAQITFIYALAYFEFLNINNYLFLYAGVLLNCIVEAFTDQVDNLVLPFLTYVFIAYA